MAQLPQLYDPTGLVFLTPGLYPDICMPIVLGTILHSGLIGPWMISNELSAKPKETTTEKIVEIVPDKMDLNDLASTDKTTGSS